jgi:hypothetical protein
MTISENSLSAPFRAALIFLALAVASACGATTARAADSQWRAKWVGNTGTEVVESGQTFPAFVKAQNIGTATWYQGTVKLAAGNSLDQAVDASMFANGSWLEKHRPATLAEQSVASGGVGTFNFTMTAPQVAVSTAFREYYLAVAEGISWMHGCPDWCGVHIPVTVEPQRAPSLTITQRPPQRVTRGDSVDLLVDATDNVGVDHVVFSLDGSDQTVTQPPYKYSFSTAGLASGSHVVTARAVDRIGLTQEQVTSFTVDRPPPGNVVINNRADFTNDPHVTLAVAAPPGTVGIRISNDPDFEGAPTLPVQTTYPWTLGSSAGDRDTRIVYVRFVDPVEGDTVVSDNIILDQTKPTIVRAGVYRRGNRKLVPKLHNNITKGGCSNAPLMLKIKARDDRSGVSGVRFGFTPRNLGRHLAFRPQVPVTMPPKLTASRALYLRVRDGAGNLSKVRKVSLRNVCK